MANPIENIQNRAAHAQASANDSLLVGQVSNVRAAQRVLTVGSPPVFDGVLCDVTITNRRSNSQLKGQPERYVLPRVRSAVPVRDGHEVFVSLTDGDPRRGAWVVGHTSRPLPQLLGTGGALTYGMLEESDFGNPVTSMPSSVTPPAGFSVSGNNVIANRSGSLYAPGAKVLDITAAGGSGQIATSLRDGNLTITSVFMDFSWVLRGSLELAVHNYRLFTDTSQYTPVDSIPCNIVILVQATDIRSGFPIGSLSSFQALSNGSIVEKFSDITSRPMGGDYGVELSFARGVWRFQGSGYFSLGFSAEDIGRTVELKYIRYFTMIPFNTEVDAVVQTDASVTRATFDMDIEEVSYPSGIQAK